MNLAYFTNRYGSASFTFIMTEVEHLRRLGHTVHTFSVRHPGGGEAVSEQVRREQAGTEYFLPPGGQVRGALGVLLSLSRTVAGTRGGSPRPCGSPIGPRRRD